MEQAVYKSLCANQPSRCNYQTSLPWIVSLSSRESSEDYDLRPAIFGSTKSKNKRLLFKVVKTNWTHNKRLFLDTFYFPVPMDQPVLWSSSRPSSNPHKRTTQSMISSVWSSVRSSCPPSCSTLSFLIAPTVNSCFRYAEPAQRIFKNRLVNTATANAPSLEHGRPLKSKRLANSVIVWWS